MDYLLLKVGLDENEAKSELLDTLKKTLVYNREVYDKSIFIE